MTSLKNRWRPTIGKFRWNILFCRAAVNKRDNFLWTPLHLACHVGDPEIVQLLLKSGAKVNKVETLNKATPIMKAIESKSLEVVKLMIQRRADVRAEDRFGQFPRFSYISYILIMLHHLVTFVIRISVFRKYGIQVLLLQILLSK